MEEKRVKRSVNKRRKNRRLARRRKRMRKIIHVLRNPQDWNLKRMAIIAGIVYISFRLVSQQVIIMDLKQERVQRQENIKKLNNEIKDLTNKIENKTDIVYIERIARDDLKMVRPGELMYEDKDDLLK